MFAVLATTIAIVALGQVAQLSAAASAGQQLAENSIGGQASFIGGNEYSALVADNLLGGLNLGQRPYTNSKRARKMSAFMPMRGRKDGRDQQQQLLPFVEGAPTSTTTSMEEQQALQLLMASGDAPSRVPGLSFREAADGDASIWRLVSAQLAANNAAGLVPDGELVRWAGTPAPRQFLARHLQQQQQQQQLSGKEFGDGGESLSGMDVASVQPASVRMQAKLRRAFHPMRGKKSDASFSDLGAEFTFPDVETDSD